MGVKPSAIPALVGAPPGVQTVQLPFSLAALGTVDLPTGLDPGEPTENKWFTVKVEVYFAQPIDNVIAQYVKIFGFNWRSDLSLAQDSYNVWMGLADLGSYWVTVEWSAGFPTLTVNNLRLKNSLGFVVVTMSPVQGPTTDPFPAPK